MSFQVTASVPTAPEAETNISNDGWFPDIDMAQAREVVRIDGTITSERLRAALIESIASVNDELETWKQLQIISGYTELSQVPASQLDNISRHIHRYMRAVYCLAKSSLLERYRDYDSSNAGNKRADELEPSIDDLRRDYRWAVNDIIGTARSTIELI